MHEAVKELRNIPLHTIYFKSCAKSLDVFCCSLINHMCTLRYVCIDTITFGNGLEAGVSIRVAWKICSSSVKSMSKVVSMYF